jgi:PEP-CTERM motif
MFRRTWIARMFVVAAATGAAIAMSAGSARAGLLPLTVTITPDAGNFRWTYSVVLPTDMKLQSGDYFTIYDFAGYQAGSAGVDAAGPDPSYADFWTVSTSKTGLTPDGVTPLDNPEIDNLTFMYNGGPSIGPGSLGLGNFFALSSLGSDAAADGAFTATALNATENRIVGNITAVVVPTGEQIPGPIGTPEPTTLALAGLGLPLIGLARYIRRNKGQPIA